jgi:uncharacterized protein (TIGR00255 family)
MTQQAAVSESPIYSMTGYATEQSATEDHLAFSLTLKGVNHRFLDLNLRLPGDCDALEGPLRRLIKDRIKRGHIDVTLHVDRNTRESGQAVHLNRELLAAYVKTFREASHLHHLNVDPSLHDLLRMPGVLSTETSSESKFDSSRGVALEAAVTAMAPALIARFNEVRAGEGAALAAELRESMLRLRTLAEEAAALRSGAREAHFERLRTRIAELLTPDPTQHESLTQPESQPSVPTQDQRLLAEAAMLAERSDVEEELVRLRAHIDSFLAMLAAGGEVGKRLDFLLQEFNREANTMLSKTTGVAAASGLRMTNVGLEMKAEIEKAREQVQNLE